MDSIGEIVNLTAVPYGNAQIDTTTQTVTCQHGEAECSANIYEQCGIALNPDQVPIVVLTTPTPLLTLPISPQTQAAWFPFYNCVEEAAGGEGGEVTEDDVQTCATTAGVDGDAIVACHDDPAQAYAMQLAASEATDPDHQYTPWVVVGGTPPYYTDGNLLQYSELLKRTVCEAYTGTKPDGCGFAARDFKEAPAVALA